MTNFEPTQNELIECKVKENIANMSYCIAHFKASCFGAVEALCFLECEKQYFAHNFLISSFQITYQVSETITLLIDSVNTP